MNFFKRITKIPSGGIKGIASNLLKNVAPVAGALTGGLGGIALGGLGSALGQATSRHPSLGGAIKAGLAGGAEAYGGSKLLGIARGGALAGAGGATPGTIGADGVPIVTRGGLASSVGDLVGTTGASSIGSEAPGTLAGPATSFGGGLASRAHGLLDFAEAHPKTTEAVASGIGAIPGQNTEARLRNAQASNLEQQANESAFDFAQRKRREELLAPVWSALGTSAGGYSKVAPNPYAGGA